MENIYLFVIPAIFGVIASIITWIVAPFFLAKREYYVKSRYELLKIKIEWCIKSFIGVTLVLAILISELFF
ncbi:hypothetical protein FUMI01_07650 [Flavobacterium sp. UMI-01]|nr:hypothetical protein FUMI01_07650 [Flavobacterium sp. UMI-01]